MPTSSALLLAACGSAASPDTAGQGDMPVQCALDGAADFEDVCTLEIVEGTGSFIIRRPDGGFRRFESDPAGGWQLADGSEQLTGRFGFDVDYVEFAVGEDRYAMPLAILPERRRD